MTQLLKFKKKSGEIRALQFFPHVEFEGICRKGCMDDLCSDGVGFPHVHTIHRGQMVALELGDWIIAEADGMHFYPCKPDVFERNYEPVKGRRTR